MKPSIHIREPARVVLIDDSSFVLDGLQEALSKSNRILVAGIARTESEAVTLLRKSRPDVVILDVRIGRASGINLCGVIRESYPNTAVLFFTADHDKYTLRSAILAGAQGYLLKGASKEAIVKSIEIVASGQTIMDRQLTPQLFASIRDGRRSAQRERKGGCSSIDLRLLSLLAAGKSNKEIAREMNIATTVVAACLRAIYKRLNVSRRSEAVRSVVHREKERLDV